MERDRDQTIIPYESDSRALLDAHRGKAAFDKLFAEGRRAKEELRDFTSRFTGQIPDAYDLIQAGVFFEYSDLLRERADAVLAALSDGGRLDDLDLAFQGHDPMRIENERSFDWSRVTDHPILKRVEDYSVSMGGGKGRREGVELGKSNPPMPVKSRWSWGRRER